MTENTTTEDEELAKLLECSPEEIRSALSGICRDLKTIEQARQAFESTSEGSEAKLAILATWVGLAKSRDDYGHARAAARGLGSEGQYACIDAMTVLLCETSEHLWWVRQDITPDSAAWPALVSRGLLILRKEKEVAQA